MKSLHQRHDWRPGQGVFSAAVLERAVNDDGVDDRATVLSDVIAAYEPTTERRSATARIWDIDLPQASTTVDLEKLKRKSKLSSVSDYIGSHKPKDPSPLSGYASDYRDVDWLFVSDAHEAAIDAWMIASAASRNVSESLLIDLDAALVEARQTLGAGNPLLVPLLYDVATISFDIKSATSQDYEQVASDRREMMREAAQLLANSRAVGDRRSQIAWNNLALTVLITSFEPFTSEREWEEYALEDLEGLYRRLQGGRCFEDQAASDARSNQILRTVQEDIELRGIREDHIGWLQGAVICQSDQARRLAIMKARVAMAEKQGDAESVSFALAHLARELHVQGASDDARAAVRQSVAVSMQLPRASWGRAIRPMGNENWLLIEQSSDADASYELWRILAPLEAWDELDFALVLANEQLELLVGSDPFFRSTNTLPVVQMAMQSPNTVLRDAVLTSIAKDQSSYTRPSALAAVLLIYEETWGAASGGNVEMLEAAIDLVDDAPPEVQLDYYSQLIGYLTDENRLEEAAGYAENALALVAAGADTLSASETDRLNRLVAEASREQGNVGALARLLVSELSRELEPACERRAALATFPSFPIDRIVDDPLLAEVLVADPVADRYLACFNRWIFSLGTKEYDNANVVPAARLRDAMYLLAAKNELNKAASVMNTALASGYWTKRRTDDPAEAIATANSSVIDGLLLGGKPGWYLDREGVMPAADGDLARRSGTYAKVIRNLGFSYDAIGLDKEARDVFDQLKGQLETPIDGDACRTHQSFCDFLIAYDSKHFGTTYNVDDFAFLATSELYFPLSDQPFASDGAQMSRTDGELRLSQHIRAGRSTGAMLYAYALFAGMSETSLELNLKYGNPLGSAFTLRLASITAADLIARGDSQRARELTTSAIDKVRTDTVGFALFGDDPLIRRAARLAPLLEAHLGTADATETHRVGVLPESVAKDLFAAQVLQSSNTAATLAKFSARRTTAGDSATLRRLQDVSASLGQRLGEVARSGVGDDQLAKQIEKLRVERDRLTQELEKTDPGLLGSQTLRLPEPDEVMRMLAPGEGVVFTYVGESATFLWLITPETLTLRRVDLPQNEIAGLVQDVRAVTDPVDLDAPLDLGVLHRAYQTLLEPFEASLPPLDTLIFVPHGPLDELPWAALLTKAPKSGQLTPEELSEAKLPWLLRRYKLAQVPSLSSAYFLRTTPRIDDPDQRAFFGVGRPDFGVGLPGVDLDGRRSAESFTFDPLTESGAEIQALARMFRAEASRDIRLDDRATEAEVRAASLEKYGVIAFATHGVLSDEVPGLSEPALILSRPKPEADPDNDGLLRASEILELRLNAELVVLSACNTAGSSGRPGAEGLSGLASAFFYAGAERLIVTHWQIPSITAAEISIGTVQFKHENPTIDWSEALRRSALNLIDSPAGSRKSHPVNWSAFMFVGMPDA